jgi:hypothetical protein
VLGFAANMVMRMTGVVDQPVSLLDAAIVGLKIGLGGAIAGTAFSAFIAFAYRNRRIQDISWVKFGIGGAIVTAVAITGFVQGASILGGGGLVPWRYMNSTLGLFAAFGFGAAAVSMKLAQRAAAQTPTLPPDDESPSQLASGAGAIPLQQRARANVDAQRLERYT